MTGEDNLSTVRNQVLNSGNSGSNPSIISDVLVVIERDIQIGPDEDLLALQVGSGEVPDTLLGHGGNTSDRLGGGFEGSEPGGNMVGENWVGSNSSKAKAAEGSLGEEAGGGDIEGGRPSGGG